MEDEKYIRKEKKILKLVNSFTILIYFLKKLL